MLITTNQTITQLGLPTRPDLVENSCATLATSMVCDHAIPSADH